MWQCAVCGKEKSSTESFNGAHVRPAGLHLHPNLRPTNRSSDTAESSCSSSSQSCECVSRSLRSTGETGGDGAAQPSCSCDLVCNLCRCCCCTWCCSECWDSHLSSKYVEGRSEPDAVECPVPGCTSILSLDQFLHVASPAATVVYRNRTALPPEFVVPDLERLKTAVSCQPEIKEGWYQCLVPTLQRQLSALRQPDLWNSLYTVKTPPGPDDWLSLMAVRWAKEPLGQSLEEYILALDSGVATPGVESRRKIRFLPILDPSVGSPLVYLKLVMQFFEAYYLCECELGEALMLQDIKGVRLKTSKKTNLPRANVDDFVAGLQPFHTKDSYCVVGITMIDLFALNLGWVFGTGDPVIRTCALSFARYHPRFGTPGSQTTTTTTAEPSAAASAQPLMPFYDEIAPESPAFPEFLRRILQLVYHEVGHVIGLAHCVWWQCCMNGANSLAESDAQPLCLCPAELSKLAWWHMASNGTHLDLVQRATSLSRLYHQHHLTHESQWESSFAEKMTSTMATDNSPIIPHDIP
ncbi:hypothetical protein Pelo_10669 [Pelomyxa schiedti]|nr:hypothetical protein Pelo_10669 [Pelomyxa schiedti]